MDWLIQPFSNVCIGDYSFMDLHMWLSLIEVYK